MLFLCCFGQALPAQPLGVSMKAVPFKLYIRFSEPTSRLIGANAIHFLSTTEDSAHVQQVSIYPGLNYDIPNRKYTATLFSTGGNAYPDLFIIRHDEKNDTMLLKFRFYVPPGITDTVERTYTIPSLTFFAGTYEVNEVSIRYFEYMSLDDDQYTEYWHLSDSIHSRDSAGYRIATQSTQGSGCTGNATCNVGWTGTWSKERKLKTLVQYDYSGSPDGYAIEYYPDGRVRQIGHYETHHGEAERVKLTLFGFDKTIGHYVTTTPSGTWICYRADGTEYYRGPYDEKVMKKFKRKK